MRLAILAVLLGTALLAGCGDDDSGGPAMSTKTTTAAAERTDTIRIADFKYDPSPASARAGQRITIPNADAAPHTLTDAASARAFDSGTIKGKTSGSITFATAGTYSYVCEFHPFMKGEITVTR